jgi:hypothetical protein
VGGDDGVTVTLEEALAIMPPIWEAIERTVLEQVAADAIAAGFNRDDVRQEIGKLARLLREGHAERLETAAAMLKTGAISLQ